MHLRAGRSATRAPFCLELLVPPQARSNEWIARRAAAHGGRQRPSRLGEPGKFAGMLPAPCVVVIRALYEDGICNAGFRCPDAPDRAPLDLGRVPIRWPAEVSDRWTPVARRRSPGTAMPAWSW